MKKMLFSAIALVAFSATSMAGEIEETKVVSEIKTEINTQESKIILYPIMSYCEKLYLRIQAMVYADTNDPEFSSRIANAAFQECVGDD